MLARLPFKEELVDDQSGIAIKDELVVAGAGLPRRLDAPDLLSPMQDIPRSPFIVTAPSSSTPLGSLGSAYHGTVGFFSQELPLSLLITTVIMGVMLLGAWAYKVTHYQHIAEAPSKSVPSEAMPELVFVGRITGMVDVKWSDDPHYLPPPGYAYVPLGRKYILDAGLMEITYDSGAKILLQGPCTYEVESTAGGYLALGKLTAKVEKKRSEVRGQRSDHSPLSPLPSPLFSVRTPTAVVTDLGTEFGVEVDKSGVTESHVFRGSVKVAVLATGENGGAGREVILRENESARVQPDKGAEDRLVIVRGAADPTAFSFVRPGQLAQVVQERQLGPLRRWQAFSEELRKRDDLLAYYDFQPDEGDRLVLRNRAATGRQFDGRIGSAPWVAGRFPGKYALQFGRFASGVRVNRPTECRQLTLAAWVRIDALAPPEDYANSLLSSNGWAHRGQLHWYIRHDGAMTLGVWEGMNESSRSVFGKDDLGRWRFVAVAYDSNVGKVGFHVDGDCVGEQAFSAENAAAVNLGAAMIGNWDTWDVNRDAASNSDQNRVLRGCMEELMIFRAALPPEEIGRLFQRGAASAVEQGAATAAEKKVP